MLPAGTPPAIRRLVRRCLEKEAARRLHDIADARLEIEDAVNGTSDAPVQQAAAAGRRWIAWTAAATIAVSGAAAAAAWMFRARPVVPEARLEMNTPPTRDASIAVSPDGRTIAYVVTAAGQPQLWLRSLDSASPRLLAGTEHATLPFWSPDSRSIGFFAEVFLKRVDVDGAAAQTLKSQIGVPIGGSWNRDGVILFSDNPAGPISRVSASGGVSTAVTRVDTPRQRGHHLPQFLPDERHFLFFVTGGADARGVYVGQIDRPETTRLFDADGAATYAAPGYLLFVRGRKFYAQRFDPDTRALRGDPFGMDERVTGNNFVTASGAGPIAYRSSPPDSGQRQLVSLDRAGRQLDKVVYADTAAQGPALSHDGRRIAVYRFADGNMDLWSYDTRRRTWDRLTFDPGDDIFPLWSQDDTAMVYSAVRREGTLSLLPETAQRSARTRRTAVVRAGRRFRWTGPLMAVFCSTPPRRHSQGPTSGRCRSTATASRSTSSRPGSTRGWRSLLPTESGLPTSPTRPAATRSTCGLFPVPAPTCASRPMEPAASLEPQGRRIVLCRG